MTMPHCELIRVGAAYMRRTLRCSPVVTERKTVRVPGEVPDVLGWRVTYPRTYSRQPNPEYAEGYDTLDSFLFECKASRSDFLRDKNKSSRIDAGYGRYRYYLAPEGIINPEDLPEKWGLILVNSRGAARKAIGAEFWSGGEILRRELLLFRSLAQELERLQREGAE